MRQFLVEEGDMFDYLKYCNDRSVKGELFVGFALQEMQLTVER